MRFCEAKPYPLTMSNRVRFWPPGARCTVVLGQDSGAGRSVPAGFWRAPRREAQENTGGRRRKKHANVPTKYTCVYTDLVHVQQLISIHIVL